MPVKAVKVRDRDAMWITPEIKKLIIKKNKTHKLAKRINTDWAWASFRRVRNDLTATIRRRKIEFMTDLDNRISSPTKFGSKDWWRLVKAFI